jgi:hypothetical protein
MPTFRRNILSPSSGAEVTRKGSRGLVQVPEEQGMREGSQSEGGNMGTGCGPIGSRQAGYKEGAVCGVNKNALFRAHRRASCSC